MKNRATVLTVTMLLAFCTNCFGQNEMLKFLTNTMQQMRTDTTGLTEQMGLGGLKNDIDPVEFAKFLEDMNGEDTAAKPQQTLEQTAAEALYAGEYQTAIEQLEQIAQKERKRGNWRKYVAAVRQLSTAHNYISNYNKSLFYALEALDIDSEHRDTLGMAADYMALGSIQLNIKEYKAAETNFETVLLLAANKSAMLERDARFNLGNIYIQTGQPGKALPYLLHCKQVDSLAKNYDNLIDDYTSLSYTYYHTTPIDTLKLFRCMTEASKYVVYNNGQSSSLGAMVKMASLSRKFGLYEQAHGILQAVDLICMLLNRPLEEAAGAKELAHLYADQQNYPAAYRAFTDFYEMNDSLFNLEKNRELKKLLVEYETVKKEKALAKSERERKEKELRLAVIEKELLSASLQSAEQDKKLLQSQNTIQRNKLEIADKEKQRATAELQRAEKQKQLTYLAFIALAVIGLLTGAYYLRQRRLTEQYVSEALTALKSQMERHFTYGTISSVRHAIAKEPARADEFLKGFEDYVRAALEIAEHPETTLQQELNELKNYIQFEKLFPYNHFEYRFNIDSRLNAAELKVPSLILQPLVENAIKHGFTDIEYQGYLDISVERHGNMLQCSVRDNGRGRRMDKVTREPGRTSKGTKITQRRIQLYNQIKNKQARFEINDLPQGVEVVLTLPEITAA